MLKKMRLNLSTKFIIAISATIVPIMLVLLSTQLWIYYSNNRSNAATVQAYFQNELSDKQSVVREDLRVRGETILAFLAQLGPEKMTVFDFDSLNKITAEVAKNKEVLAAVYYDNEGGAVTDEVEVNDASPLELKTELKDPASGETVGVAKLWLTTRFTDEIIKRSEESMAKNISSLEQNFDSQARSLTKVIGLVSVAAILLINLVVFVIVKLAINKPLNRSIDHLTEASNKLYLVSDHISSASQSLADGSSQQAASIEETSASLEEMSAMTKQNAEHAGEAKDVMHAANIVVGETSARIMELTDSMQEISKASEETSSVVKSIDEIAFQTNLLALNAAVEAARAGEAGAGFAVVADEVRNLAMRAAESAGNTAELIEGTVGKIHKSSELVKKTDEAFEKLVESSSKAGQLVGEIATASHEQAQGVDQVNSAVSEMDQVTQQNAANAEESASASEEMHAQAEQMNRVVGDLVALVSGSREKSKSCPDRRDKGPAKAKAPVPEATKKENSPASAKMQPSANREIGKITDEGAAAAFPMDDDDFSDF